MIRSRLLALRDDRRGSVAIIFALVAFVIVGVAFGVADYSRAVTAKKAMQDALDSATLAAARSKAVDAAALQTAGEQFMTGHLSQIGARDITSTFTGDSTKVVGHAQGYIDPIVLGVFLRGPMQIGVDTQVVREATLTTEIALVLDTTASMSGAKITALKSSAKDLVQKVMTGASGQVKVAVVPFANYVNIGVSRRNEPWANVPADYVQSVAASCTDNTTTSCAVPAKPYTCTTYNDGVPNPNGTCYTAATGCTTVKTGTQTCKAASSVNHTFRGCVGSPAYPKNVRDDDPTRRYPGFLDTSCTTEFTPLTAIQGTAVAATQALTAAGDTYIPAGLAWGFNMLSAPVPMTEAAPYDPKGMNMRPRKVLVLMTDGANSMAMNASNGSHGSIGGAAPVQATQYTKELCDNIKAAKIEVFSVAFTIADPTAKALVQYCASDSAHFYDAADTAGLSAAFTAIADALQVIHISR